MDAEKTERMVAGRVKGKLLKAADALNDLGYTDTEIVRHGIRALGKREKVCA